MFMAQGSGAKLSCFDDALNDVVYLPFGGAFGLYPGCIYHTKPEDPACRVTVLMLLASGHYQTGGSTSYGWSGVVVYSQTIQ